MTKAKVNELWVSGFTADTPVIMANGKIKPISKIQEGEWVASFDPVTKHSKPGLVTNTWSETMNDVLEVDAEGITMLVASNQRFYTPSGEFKIAPDAEAVLSSDGTSKKISAKKYRGGKVKLYDLTIDDSHAFYAYGLMVHNKGRRAPPPPPPPPDPVVTAGKIGQPLTVGVNGTNITVNPPAGSVATVSVNYNGGANTGYHSVPGVATFNPVMAIVTAPAANYGTASYNYVQSAKITQTQVCDSMSQTSGRVSTSLKKSWQAQLDNMKSNVALAQRNDKRWYAAGNDNSAPRDRVYSDVINDIVDLRKFVNKDKNISSGDQNFIAAKCAEIEGQLTSLSQSLQPSSGVAVPQPAYVPEGRIYSTNPNYAYASKFGVANGCEAYRIVAPNDQGPIFPTYYKHFDTSSGLFYFDLTSVNCV